MIFGLDHLGLAKYSKRALQSFPNGWALGCFAETFGDSFNAAKAILDTGKCSAFRVQLIWSDTHQFGDKDIPKIKKLTKKWAALAAQYSIPFYISPFCEHNVKNPDKYLDIVQNEGGSGVIPVNTVWNGALSKHYTNEIHGDHAKPAGKYLYSHDGSSAVDDNIEQLKKKYAAARVYFMWVPQFNGRKTATDNTPRPQRKAWPTRELIESVIYLAKDKGPTKLSKEYLWKSHSDQHNAPKPEPRALRPVFISPHKVKYYTLKDPSTGATLGKLNYFGPFDGGGHRYYLPEFGYKVSQAATSQIVEVLNDRGVSIGQVNPAFREGKYR